MVRILIAMEVLVLVVVVVLMIGSPVYHWKNLMVKHNYIHVIRGA